MPSRPMKLRRKRNALKEEEICPEEFIELEKDVMTSFTSNSPPTKKCKLDGEEQLLRLLLQTTREMEELHRHHHFPAFNVSAWPPQDCGELRNYPCCSFSAVQPVHVASKHSERVDICHRRTIARECYKKRLLSARTRFQTARQNNRKLRSMEKQNIYHMSLFNLAERLKRNPDPLFHGNYDYYYTGGNLCVLPEKSNYVLHVGGENLQTLNIGELALDHIATSISLHPVCTRTIDSMGEIFEVRPLRSSQEGLHNLFGVRQRNNITLHSLLPEQRRTKPLTQFKTCATPLISFAQSDSDPSILLISSMKQQLRRYDLNAPTATLKQLYNLSNNEDQNLISWNTVKAWRNQSSFIYANEQKLCCVDMRTTPKEWLKSNCGFSDDDFGCERISSLASSEFGNLLYVGTSHKLHCLDVRYMRKHFESEGAVCRWTHQLEYAPSFMATSRQSGVEHIALASALAGDLTVCELTRQLNVEQRQLRGATEPSKHLYKSYCLPYQPPTLHEAYESARQAGMCLQPEADLAHRLRSCTTGLSICGPFPSSGAATSSTVHDTRSVLLTSNSNGDVFAQGISDRASQAYEPRTNRFSNEVMCKYAEQICQVTQPDLNHTDVIDMSAMSNVFRCTALNILEMAEEVAEVSVPKHRALGRWQKSMSTLYSYKDALVQDMLAIWDIDYEEEKHIKLGQLNESQRIKPDPSAIVTSWLNSTAATQPTQPMTVIPARNLSVSYFDVNTSTVLCTPNQTLDEEFSKLPQSTQIMEETVTFTETSNLEMQQTLNTTTIVAQTKTKIAKKKSKYIKGF